MKPVSRSTQLGATDSRHPSRRESFALLGLSLLGLSGCAGYRFGNALLHRPDIRSVHVPIFESDSFRRGLGLRLTEAVVRQISTRTPYAIGSETGADTILRGRILEDRKHVLGETINDDPRNLQIDLKLEVTWITRTGTPLMERVTLKIDDNVSFVPEAGQSMATAQQELIDDIAKQIVDQMEDGW